MVSFDLILKEQEIMLWPCKALCGLISRGNGTANWTKPGVVLLQLSCWYPWKGIFPDQN